MDAKDILTIVGITAAFVIGLFNLFNSQRTARQTRLVSTITTERVKWIQELKGNISELCGSVHSWMLMYSQENPPSANAVELLKKIDRLRYHIRLQLNPNKSAEKCIEEAILRIPTLTNQLVCSELQAALDAVTAQTQILLRAEWIIIKKEVITGKLDLEKIQQT